MGLLSALGRRGVQQLESGEMFGLLPRVRAAQQRMSLSKLEDFDPIDGFRPWDLRGGSLEDADVLAALSSGRLKTDRYVEGAPWSARDHAERIAWLMRNAKDDPITLSRDADGFPQVEDGYHRLAAARLRGDRDIPVTFSAQQRVYHGSPLPFEGEFRAGTSFAERRPLAEYYANRIGQRGQIIEADLNTDGFVTIKYDPDTFEQEVRAAQAGGAPGVRIEDMPDGYGLRDTSPQFRVFDGARARRIG